MPNSDKMRLDEDWDDSSMSPVFPSYIIKSGQQVVYVLLISVMQTLLSSTCTKHSSLYYEELRNNDFRL